MAAIEREDASESFDPSLIPIESSYTGPRLEKDTNNSLSYNNNSSE